MKLPSIAKLRLYALLCILPTVVLAGFALSPQGGQHLLAHGPLLASHQALACADCHLSARGTTRQQVQAQLRFALGLRQAAVDFGYQRVTSDQCIACHDRPNDRHPIYRFQEPRFQTAIQQVPATSCLGCHSEHGAVKITSGATYCAACHVGLKIAVDPIDIPHETLISDERWNTCMQCHDYHGNHQYSVPHRLDAGLDLAQIQRYLSGGLEGGVDPYGGFKSYRAVTP